MVSKNTARVLTVFTLAMINVAAVSNLGQLSLLSLYGLSGMFFIGFAAIMFFIPASLVSAELATGWPKTGGVYIWVREALGSSWGFLAIWLQWIENVIWYPTILSFCAATIAFIINPGLATNSMYTFGMILLITWGVTLINFKGMKVSGSISKYGVMIGTIFPAFLVILMGLIWVFSGNPTQITFDVSNAMPDLSSLNNLVLLVGIMLGLAGIEMSSVHAQEVKNPQTDYPKAILISVVIILIIAILGSLSIAMVVPKTKILLTAGVMEAFQAFFTAYNIQGVVPILAALIALGSITMISTWMVGPSKGLLAAADDGNLPPMLQKMNKNGMPTHILITQSVIISLLALVFVFMPSINSSYWILTDLTSQLYLVMYVLMFVSAIKLKYSKPNVKRAYSVPGGKTGMWIVAGLGILACLFAFFIGFVPPAQVQTGGEVTYDGFLGGGVVVACLAAVLIHHFRKPNWKPKKKKLG